MPECETNFDMDEDLEFSNPESSEVRHQLAYSHIVMWYNIVVVLWAECSLSGEHNSNIVRTTCNDSS